MNLEETANLLTFCAAFDARTIGDADVLAWNTTLARLPFVDARTAVSDHYARESRRIMPADVIAGVKQIRKARTDKADVTFVPDCDPDDTAEYQRQLAAHRRAIGDGVEPPSLPALERAVPPTFLQRVFRRVPRAIEAPKRGPVPADAEAMAQARAEVAQLASRQRAEDGAA